MDLSPALENLNDRERVVVEGRLRGMSQAAIAQMAGTTLDVVRAMLGLDHIRIALQHGRQISADFTAITREKLTAMLMEAYQASATATEQILAVRELAKLHGLNAPTQVSIDHTHRLTNVKTERDLKQLTVAELERLALMHPHEIIEGEFTPVARLTQDVANGAAAA